MRLYKYIGRLEPKPGEIGIEVEIEAECNLPSCMGWMTTHDHSLKGNYTSEYVIKGPVNKDTAAKSLDRLQRALIDKGSNSIPSVRTGVHIHLNMQDNTRPEIFKTAMVYYTLESIITQYCGINRSGNLFCLRAVDCPGIEEVLENAFTGNFAVLNVVERFKYSSLNFCTLFTHGSLEFRAFKTPKDLNKISTWVDIVCRLKEYACEELKSVHDIPYELSYLSPEEWAKTVLTPELYQEVTKDFNVEYDVNATIKQDMRNLQTLYHTPVKELG